MRRCWLGSIDRQLLWTFTLPNILNSTNVLSVVYWSHVCVCGRNGWNCHLISILFPFINSIFFFLLKSSLSVCEGSVVASYWCVASSGRWGCTSGRRTGSCRCWACTPWPPGWACSCAPVHRTSHRRTVCPETCPRPRCGTETGVWLSVSGGGRAAPQRWMSPMMLLQLIDEDVRNPNVGRRYRHLFDRVKVFWVPHQELVGPRLGCSAKGRVVYYAYEQIKFQVLIVGHCAVVVPPVCTKRTSSTLGSSHPDA